MMDELKNLAREQRLTVLAAALTQLSAFPLPERDGTASTLTSALVRRLREQLTATESDRADADARIIRLLTREYLIEALPPDRERLARARLGSKGILPADQYDISVSNAYRDVAKHFGFTVQRAIRCVREHHAEQVLGEIEEERPGDFEAYVVFTRANEERVDDPSIDVVLAERRAASLVVRLGFEAFLNDLDVPPGADPVRLFLAFMRKYGIPLAPPRRRPSAIILNETVPIPPGPIYRPDRGLDILRLIGPRRRALEQFSIVNAKASELHTAVIYLALMIDLSMYKHDRNLHR